MQTILYSLNVLKLIVGQNSMSGDIIQNVTSALCLRKKVMLHFLKKIPVFRDGYMAQIICTLGGIE